MPYSRQTQQSKQQFTINNELASMGHNSNSLTFGSLSVGSRVIVDGGKVGVIRFLGPVHFKEGIWCGIELDLPIGKNNGTVYGVCYFTCKLNHGLFVSPTKVSLFTGTNGSIPQSASHMLGGSSQLLRTPAEIVRMTPFVDYSPMEIEYRQRNVTAMNRPFGASTAQSNTFGNGNLISKQFGDNSKLLASTSIRPVPGEQAKPTNSATPQKYQSNSVSTTPTVTVPPSTTSKYSSAALTQLQQENDRSREEIEYLKGQISTYLVQLNEQKLAFSDLKRKKEDEVEDLLTRISDMMSSHELAIYQYKESMEPIFQIQQQFEELKEESSLKDTELLRMRRQLEDLELMQEKMRTKDEEIQRLNRSVKEVKDNWENETISLQSTINQYKSSLQSLELEKQTLALELQQLQQAKPCINESLEQLTNDKVSIEKSNEQLQLQNSRFAKTIDQLEGELTALRKSLDETNSKNYAYSLSNQELSGQLASIEKWHSELSAENLKIDKLEQNLLILQQENSSLQTELNVMREMKLHLEDTIQEMKLRLEGQQNSPIEMLQNSQTEMPQNSQTEMLQNSQMEIAQLQNQLNELSYEKSDWLTQIEMLKGERDELQKLLNATRNQSDNQNLQILALKNEFLKLKTENERQVLAKNEYIHSLELARTENSRLEEQIICTRQSLQEKENEFSRQLQHLQADHANSLASKKQMELENALQNINDPLSSTDNIVSIQRELEQNIGMIQNVINLTNGNRNDLENISQLVSKIEHEKDNLVKEISKLLQQHPQQAELPTSCNVSSTCRPADDVDSLRQIQSIVDGLEKGNNYDQEVLHQIFNSLCNDFCHSCQLPGHLAENCFLAKQPTAENQVSN